MDPITAAMALSQFAPAIIKWMTGSDKASEVASQVVEVAKQVTGAATTEAAVEGLRADPTAVLQFRTQIAAQEADLDKAYLLDRQSARERDVRLAEAGMKNTRANWMIVLVTIGLLSCLWMLTVWRQQIPPEVVGIISTIAGIFGLCLRDAFQFEFGSSRDSMRKDQTIANLTKSQ